MSFALTVIFLILTFLSPAEVIPALAPFRPMLVLILFGGLGALLSFLNSGHSPRTVPQLVFMALLTLWALGSLPLHGWFGGLLVAAQTFLPSALIFFIIIGSVKRTSQLSALGWVFFLISLYYGIRGIGALNYGVEFEKYTVQQAVYVRDPDGTTIGRRTFPRVRGVGTLGDPNDLGQQFVISLPFLFLAWKKRNPLWNLLIILPPVGVILYGLYHTHSRGALIGIFVLVALWLRNKIGMAGPIVSLAFTAFLLIGIGFGGGRAVSVGDSSGRLELWSDTISLLKSNPIFGVGYNAVREFTKHTTHNSFLQCAVELGLPGYFLWLSVIVCTVLALRQVCTIAGQDPQAQLLRRQANAILLSLYAFLATSWFLSRAYATSLYVLAGMAAAVYLIAFSQRRVPGNLMDQPWLRYSSILLVGSLVGIYILVRLRWLTGG